MTALSGLVVPSRWGAPVTFSNSKAGPPDFITRSATSVISKYGLNGS
jgi:hypothetical protein